MSHPDSAPIFFVGVPRSGTTITFEHFAAHPDLAWVLNYARVLPRVPAINLLRRLFDNRLFSARGSKNQFDDLSALNRYLPRPDESYEFWNAYAAPGFDRAFLLDTKASAAERAGLSTAVSKIRRYQGRARVTAKMTGPGRVAYLHSVWPQMYIVHVVRDGVDVVRSLLNVPFWKKRGGYTTPWWQGGITPDELERWEAAGSEPGALAALQWRRIVETTRAEAQQLLGERYIEVRYEEFLEAPEATIADIYQRTGLALDKVQLEPLHKRNQAYKESWDAEYRASLVEWMQPVYGTLGYSL